METTDRLGHLPDDMLHHILSFIPETEEIARTSVLSKRFRRLWQHHFTSLELDEKYPTCPDSFTGFPFLLRLHIRGPIPGQTLARLISKCPSLRSLTLFMCPSLDSLDISSETLSEVSISYCPALQSVRLDVPNLVSIVFQWDTPPVMDALRVENARHLLDARMVTFKRGPVAPPGLIEDLRHISRRLEVDDWFFGFALPRSPNPKFENLKELHCDVSEWVTPPVLSGIVSMLQHCPNLEQLCVGISGALQISYIMFPVHKYSSSPPLDKFLREHAFVRERQVWDPSEAMEGFEDWRPSRLKFVVVESFLGTTNEIKLLEYLLSRGSALEKLTIDDGLMRSKEEIHQLLAHIPRASRKLQILPMK